MGAKRGLGQSRRCGFSSPNGRSEPERARTGRTISARCATCAIAFAKEYFQVGSAAAARRVQWEVPTMIGKIAAGAFVVAASMAAGLSGASALTLYCSADEVWCQQMARDFEAETGITVDMTRKSAGETYAQVRAEASNPKGDIWWAGTGDPHLQAADEGLSEPYVSPMRSELHDWALRQAEAAGDRTIGVYSGALGFGYNKDLLAKNNLPEPKCWADLIKPEYKGQMQVADPNSSGTAYTLMAKMIQLMGEDEAFEYLEALHKNINQYTKSGSAPIKAAGLGETTVGIVFMHDAVDQTVPGFPIVTVAPCEGTGYEIGSMSIIKGA